MLPILLFLMWSLFLARPILVLQERLGVTTKDGVVWLTRDQFGMTFLDQVGLMGMSDLLELSKGLSKIGAKAFVL